MFDEKWGEKVWIYEKERICLKEKKNTIEIGILLDSAIHSNDNNISWWGRCNLWEEIYYYVLKEVRLRLVDLRRDMDLVEEIMSACKLKILSDAANFDSSLGTMTMFAKGRILHVMQDEINMKYTRTTPYYSQNILNVRRATEQLRKAELPITLSTLMAKTGLPPKKIEDSLELIERTKQVSWEAMEDSRHASIPNPEDYIIKQEEILTLYEAVMELPDIYRDVIVLEFDLKNIFDKYPSIKHLKRYTGLPENQIREIRAKALKILSENQNLVRIRGNVLRRKKSRMEDFIPINSIDERMEATLLDVSSNDDLIEEGVVVSLEEKSQDVRSFEDELLIYDTYINNAIC